MCHTGAASPSPLITFPPKHVSAVPLHSLAYHFEFPLSKREGEIKKKKETGIAHDQESSDSREALHSSDRVMRPRHVAARLGRGTRDASKGEMCTRLSGSLALKP